MRACTRGAGDKKKRKSGREAEAFANVISIAGESSFGEALVGRFFPDTLKRVKAFAAEAI